MNELKNQVKQLLEENKLEVVEMKTAFGDLNDEGSKYQFYIAALVKSNGTAVPQATADAMNKLFTDAGLITQTTSVLESPYLVKKGMPFRSAYKISGQIVAQCIREGLVLENLPLAEYQKHSELFEEDLYNDIDLLTCVEKRISEGGTSVSSVEAQIAYVKENLA